MGGKSGSNRMENGLHQGKNDRDHESMRVWSKGNRAGEKVLSGIWTWGGARKNNLYSFLRFDKGDWLKTCVIVSYFTKHSYLDQRKVYFGGLVFFLTFTDLTNLKKIYMIRCYTLFLLGPKLWRTYIVESTILTRQRKRLPVSHILMILGTNNLMVVSSSLPFYRF